MSLKDTPLFIIENKILKGRRITLPDDNKNLGERILENLKKNPELIALTNVQTGETSTYKKLTDDSIRCALWLKKQGIGPGDIVSICTHNNIASWALFCAIFYVGGNLTPWYYDLSPESAKHCLHLTKPKIIFANEKAGKMLQELVRRENFKTKIIIFGKISGLESFDDILRGSTANDIESFRCSKIDPDSDCLIMFSSGSTGLPKGVQHSYKAMFYNAYKWGIIFEETLGKPSIWTSTMYWITGNLSMLRSLIFMCPTFIVNDPSPEELCKIVEKHQTDVRTGETSTYKKLADDSIRCALWLKKQGIGSGDTISICTHNNIPSWASFCAIFYIGANLNPWYYDWSPESAKHFLHLTKPKIIFANEKAGKMLQELIRRENFKTKIIVFGKVPGLESFDDILKGSTANDIESFRCSKIDPDSDCLIMFSSGSTGLPKGVQHSYKAMFYNAYKWGMSFEETLGKPTSFTSTMYWITGILAVSRSLLFSCPTFIMSDPTPEEMCQAIEKHQIQWMFTGTGITNELSLFEDSSKYDLSCLKFYITGGSKIRSEVIKKLNQVFKNNQLLIGYGITELGGGGICQEKNAKRNVESTGIVFLDMDLKIVDVNTGETMGSNQLGELCFKQKYMMKHYLNNPKATAEAFTPDGFFRSGDLGYYDDEGNIFIKERIKEVIKYRGHQISPAEIESILLKHPDVLEAIVVPVSHPIDDEHPFAFVKKAKNSKVTEKELLEMTSVLGETKRLRGGCVFLEKFPVNSSTKIDKKRLREMAEDSVAKEL